MIARDVIDAARRMALQSWNLYAPALKAQLTERISSPVLREAVFAEELQHRTGLVMDCYLTGAAEMLKLLCGDSTPEPWSEDYAHESRLEELLELYRARAVNSTVNTESPDTKPSGSSGESKS